jgi:hypothetical protein
MGRAEHLAALLLLQDADRPGAYKRCANPLCVSSLSTDCVTLTTTFHVRRFCTVQCLIESFEIANETIWARSRYDTDERNALLMVCEERLSRPQRRRFDSIRDWQR